MGAFLAGLWDEIVDYWTIADGLLRIPLAGLLLWPFVLTIVGMIGVSPLTAIVALGPYFLLGGTFLLSPSAWYALWKTGGRAPIRNLILAAGIELLIGFYLAGVPVENYRLLVPTFILAAVTLAVFLAYLASGTAEPWVKSVVTILWLAIAGMTVMFFLKPHWEKITATNPVTWWGFLFLGILAALAAWHLLKGGHRFVGLAAVLFVWLVGWQLMYAGRTLTVPLVAMTTSTRSTLPPAPGATLDTIVVEKDWNRVEIPLDHRANWQEIETVEYEVRVPGGKTYLFEADTLGTAPHVKLPGKRHRWLEFRTTKVDAAHFEIRFTPIP